MRIKVLHIITSLDADGAQNMLLKLCQHVSSDQFEFKILNMRGPTDFCEKFDGLGIEIEHLGMRRMIPSLSAVRKIAACIDSFQPDLIQGWMYHGNLAAIAGRLLAARKPPVLWNIRKATNLEDYKLMTRLTIRLGALCSASAAKVIYCGESIAEQHRKLGFSSGNMTIIPNGFDADRFVPSDESKRVLRKARGMAADAPVVGMTARYHPHKDHPNFLRMAAIVKASVPGVQFVLAGRGLDDNNSEIRSLAAELGVLGRLHLMGECCKVEALVPGFDVYCLSSVAEGFPNSLGEAMSCGVPCVTTSAGAAVEVVGNVGAVVPTRNPIKLATEVIRLLRLKPEARLQIGEQSRQRVIDRFSLTAVADRYAEVYRQALVVPSTVSGKSEILLKQSVG